MNLPFQTPVWNRKPLDALLSCFHHCHYKNLNVLIIWTRTMIYVSHAGCHTKSSHASVDLHHLITGSRLVNSWHFELPGKKRGLHHWFSCRVFLWVLQNAIFTKNKLNGLQQYLAQKKCTQLGWSSSSASHNYQFAFPCCTIIFALLFREVSWSISVYNFQPR